MYVVIYQPLNYIAKTILICMANEEFMLISVENNFYNPQDNVDATHQIGRENFKYSNLFPKKHKEIVI